MTSILPTESLGQVVNHLMMYFTIMILGQIEDQLKG